MKAMKYIAAGMTGYAAGVICALGLVVYGQGCAYRPHNYPLQPGEFVTFKDAARAAEYRRLSGNDRYKDTLNVEITRPCAVSCE